MTTTRTLPDGSTIEHGPDHARTWTQPDGTRLASTRYGQWEPTFNPGTQREGGCGYAPEHCHCPADDQPDLFSGAA